MKNKKMRDWNQRASLNSSYDRQKREKPGLLLLQVLVRRQRQKFDELVVGDDRIQDFGRCLKWALLELRIADG